MLTETQLVLRDKAIQIALEYGYTYPPGSSDPFTLRAPPGKYEGEPFYVVYFHSIAMDGGSDEPLYSGDTVDADVIILDDDDRAAFGLGPAADFMMLWYSSSGFVSFELADADTYDRIREAYNTDLDCDCEDCSCE